MGFKNSIKYMFRFIIENVSKNNFLKKHASFFSSSVVIAWLLKDIFTTAIINKSFTGRSLFIQLIIFWGISICVYLLMIWGYRLYQNTHYKITLDYIFYILQIFILLSSYLTIIFNFNRWIYELTGFFLFFLLNLTLSTVFFFNQHYRTIISIVQLKKRLINIVLLVIIIIYLEIFIISQVFFITTFQNLQEIQYVVKEGTLFGFSSINGGLRSEHNDPNITFSNIDNHVRYIKIQCTNPNPDALGQVFYRREYEDWTEEKSVTFPLSLDETIISLPRTIKITSLRFDLTNIEGDTVYCQGFTLNPRISYNFSYLRLVIFGLTILGLYFRDKFIEPETSNKLSSIFINNGLWFFILLIVLLGFSYPITLTYDSAHYIWLADIITTGEWASWDPIRNAGFPMLIYLSFVLFGYNRIALLLPMGIALVLLFLFSCKIAYLVLKPNFGFQKFLLTLTIFLILTLDATIFGYFHTLLTENIAATIALLSCFMALKLYESKPFSKSFYLHYLYFFIMIPFSWHIKQPYIGAALFPLLISIFLILLRQFSWKKIAVSFLFIVVSLLITLGTNVAWDSFLVSQGNPMREERHISTLAERRFSEKIEQVQQTPLEMGKRQVDHYLENINFYIRYSTEETRTPRLTQGFQNRLIAHRMYLNPGITNIIFSPYDQYTYHFKEPYAPPNWLNNLFLSRVNTSYFLFTTTYLLLPVSLLLLFIVWFRRKELFITSLMILGGTSIFNAIVHLFYHPIDRYLFLGYPLTLLMLAILLFKGLLKLKAAVLK